MSPDLTIRPMRPDELAFAAQCTENEGWASENLVSFESFYQYDPQGCLIALDGDNPLGICVATMYGLHGFIGELIVRPEARGWGLGAALLNCGISHLHNLGVKTVYLDGVLKAVSLYERNGFRKICRSLRFSGHMEGKNHSSVRPMQISDLPEVCRLDLEAFGAERGFFLKRRLELFPELCKVMIEEDRVTGFITGRRGEEWVSAGTWVVEDSSAKALCLLESLACEVGKMPISLGILEANQKAVKQMLSLGFKIRKDSPWRMVLGPAEDLGMSDQCWAVGSAAKG
jgi:ribosomal protein S18 acetylase RimI-like enzyme